MPCVPSSSRATQLDHRPRDCHPLTVDLIAEAFAPVAGMRCWEVQQGHGSSITFEFGEPRVESLKVMPMPLHIGGKQLKVPRRTTCVRGDWHLWIHCCNWALDWDGQELVHSESSREEIGHALQHLNGQDFTRVEVERKNGSSRFLFDLGFALRTWPYAKDGTVYDQWHLYQPSGVVLTVDSNGEVRNEFGSTQASESLKPSRKGQA